MPHARSCIAGLSIALVWLAASAAAQTPGTAPETFAAAAKASTQDAGATGNLTIHIQSYTDDRDRTTMTEALRIGGYPGFLNTFRKIPDVGYVELGGRKVLVRWARQQPTAKGRTITVVTDGPLFFLGGAAVDAKPRTGFQLALIQMDVDATGVGSGTMAGAARVKPGGETGVQVDDYADTPVQLTVRKSSK